MHDVVFVFAISVPVPVVPVVFVVFFVFIVAVVVAVGVALADNEVLVDFDEVGKLKRVP